MVKDGLNGRQAFNVVQDEKGFVWISTRLGIDRYDGANVKGYSLDIMYNGSYPIRTIKLLLDKKQNVWAYTDKGVIYQYNTEEDKFLPYVDLNRFLKDANFDDKNCLWIVTHTDLGYLDDKTLVLGEKLLSKSESYKSISKLSESHILIETNRNIYTYNTVTQEKTSLISEELVIQENLKIETCLYDVESSCLWIGSIDRGLYLYEIDKKKLSQIKDPRLLYHPVVTLSKLDSTYLLIGTDGVGMGLLNSRTLQIEKIYNQYSKPDEYIDGGAIYNIYKGKDGKIWLSTYSGGVYIFDYSKYGFKTIKNEKGNKNSLSRNVVCDILEDSDSQVWFATNNDISVWNKATNQWKYLLDSKNVLKLYEDSRQNIWVGTYSSGVYKLNKNGAIVKSYIKDNEGSNTIGTNFIYAIHEDVKGNMWFGGKRGPLAKLDPQTNSFTQININQINQIVDYGKDSLLVTTEIGVFSVDIHSAKWKALSINKNLKSSYVSDLYMQSDSIVWLATYGDGLNKCNIHTGSVQSFTIRNGFPSNILYALEIDDRNKLWFSSENGIGSFDINTYQVTNFSTTDGISGNQFRQQAKYQNLAGDIFFGSYDGVTYFNPNEIRKHGREARIFLENFRLFNRIVLPNDKNSPLNCPLDEARSIQLNYRQHSFSFDFSAIDFSRDKTRRYMWKLENLDSDWRGPTPEHIANYTNITDGEYIFRLRYLDDNNNILDERSILIEVTPPFWNTLWARLIFILLVGVIAYSAYIYARQRLIRKQTKEKMEFFINTAHDIRTPLTLISGPIYELKEQVSASPKTDYLLQLITSNLGKLNGVISQLLDFQKVYDQKNQLVVKKWNVNSYLTEKLTYWKSAVQKKTITLDLIHPDETIEEWFDMEKLDKILDNLVSNAIKYTPNGGHIVIELSVNEKNWQIEIKDNGIGISKQDQKGLFTRFFRARNAINSQESGSGLGLLLVQKYVLLHKGKVSVKSEENQGTEFCIQFRRGSTVYQRDVILDDYNIPILSGKLKAQDSLYDAEDMRLKVLIVEDNDELRSYMKLSLSAFYSTYVAEDGEIAWKNILKINPDIVISDLHMPNMNGFDLCKKLKTTFETSHIPVILLTVINDSTHVAEGLNIGADDYIGKPFEISFLRLKINNIIQNRQILRHKFLGINKDEIAQTNAQQENELNLRFVEGATSIIDENISNPKFSIRDLSKEMNLSRTLLFSKFSAITGYTPNDFIRIRRMKKAIAHFKENKYSISEVALMVGFEEPAYFSTSFKRMYGKTPKQFIEENLSEEDSL